MEVDNKTSDISSSYLSHALCAAFLFLLVIRGRKFRKRTGYDLLPGPRQHFMGKLLNLLEIADKRKTVKTVTDWCMKNDGPAMKLQFGPFSAVVLLSPSNIQRLYSSNDTDHLAKPYLGYGVLKPVDWVDGIMHARGEKWKARRKLINPIFSYNSLLGYIPAWNEGGRRLVTTLESHFHQKSDLLPSPIHSILADAALDSLCRTVFGIDNAGSDEMTIEFRKGTKRFLEIVATRVLQPWLGYEPLFRLHPMSKQLRHYYHHSRKFVQKLASEVVEEQEDQLGEEAASKQQYSLLKDLLAAGLQDRGIYEETMTVLLTGFETTGNVLHSLLFFLALNPGVQERCRGEVDHVFENDEFCKDGVVSACGIKQLQYLEQCLLETLRMIPASPAFCRELEGPLQLEGDVEVPAGTTVGLWVLGIHMNPELYPEPGRFDPDRFSPEMRTARHPFSYMPFSAGPRKCIGHKFGMMELLIDAAHILRRFTISTATERFEDVVWLYNTTLQPETPIKFVFEKRGNLC